ncbi:hypothetical protein NW768_007688 [Fusarium equiseti]|uniref:Endonuclease/exonuclease/phosphatase domain-containing protein n=1 Tax=Fusarium equiseti TaxID=61235 RepID=A0ABQ8R870_FUSEQ|nr:hypothetical protein NW768_007688 [Fusarium equiseti]
MAMTVDHVEELLEITSRYERNIVMGDFNLHNPSWSGSLFRGDPKTVAGATKALRVGMQVNGLDLVTVPGTETFVAGKGDNVIRSCIDLTFVSSSLRSSVESWPNSDHHPVRTILDLQVERDDTLRFHWDDTDSKRYNEILKDKLDVEELKKLELLPPIIDEQLDLAITTILEAIDTTVPTTLAFAPPPDKPLTVKDREHPYGNGAAPAPAEAIPNSQAQREYREARKRERDKANTFTDKLEQCTNGTWTAARI